MDDKRKLWKVWLFRLGETVLSLALVLACFLGFMAILGKSFPQGTGLGALLDFEERARLERRTQLRFESEPEAGLPMVAKLTAVTRRVLDKDSRAISWSDAHTGALLEDRHAVQTFERSGASISFGEDDELRLGPNSLVIIRRAEEFRGQRRRRASLLMLGGEVQGRIGRSSGEQIELEIVTAGASGEVRSTLRSDTSFRVESHKDQSSTFSILDGSAEITAGGRRYALTADEALSVGPTGAPVHRFRLPSTPAAAVPADRAIFAFKDGPPEIAFSWEPAGNAQGYRLEIATDEAFEDIVADPQIAEASFVHGYLDEGLYYWRVSGTRDGTRGRTSAPRTFEVRYDNVPPDLQVAFPQDPLHGPALMLRGTTEPSTKVFVGGSSVEADAAGQFEIALNLAPGPNLVVVEAFDAAGNVSYRSQYVRAEY